MAARFRLGDVVKVAKPVIILRPVHERNVAQVRTGHKLLLSRDASVHPQVQSASSCRIRRSRVEADGTPFQCPWLTHRPAKKLSRPGGLKFRDVVTPEAIFLWLVD